MVEALSEANTGTGRWELGWTVLRIDGDEVIAATERLRTRLPAADCRAEAGALRPGAAIGVRVPKGLPELAPGFYTAVGDTAPPTAGGSLLRVYWNVASRGAPALVRIVTSRLNRERVSFRLKVADHGLRFDRCDAAVLYAWCDAFADVAGALRGSAAELEAYLGPRTPAFTLQLAPGVGLAEDGGDGESFGIRRCSLLAEGIARAHAREVVSVDERVDVVAERFAEEGIAIDAPYRDPSLANRHVL